MKTFWGFLALFFLAAISIWVVRSPQRSPSDPQKPLPEPIAATAPLTPPEPTPEPDPVATNDARFAQELEKTLPKPPESPAAATNPAPPPEPAHADLTAALLGDADSFSETSAPKPSKAVQETTATTKSGGNPKLGPAKIEKRDDGTTLVDDRFVLRGKGTKEAPYEISWEFLTSAQETYQPRLGMKNLPDRLNIVNNKWVKISGYIAFPLMAETPDEMLMMLNQWDGCCIGVPPTPYDALEVKLSTPATKEQRLAVDGAVSGVIRVDPYLVKDWLVSMYLLDDARLVQDSATGPEKKVRDPNAHLTGAPASSAP